MTCIESLAQLNNAPGEGGITAVHRLHGAGLQQGNLGSSLFSGRDANCFHGVGLNATATSAKLHKAWGELISRLHSWIDLFR